MTPIVTAILSLVLQQSAVPPPLEQVTANCAAPVYASDQLICSDPELRDAEVHIGELWRTAGPNASSGPWLEPQDAWFRRRALCAFQTQHRACLLSANAERITVLSTPTQIPARPVSARCTSHGSTQTVSLDRSNGWVAAYDQQGLAWLALRTNGDWKPFVSWTGGRTLTFKRLDGSQLNCRINR